MRRYYFLPILMMLLTLSLSALTLENPSKDKAIQKLRKLKPEEFYKFHQPKHPSYDKIELYHQAALQLPAKSSQAILQSKEQYRMSELPSNFRLPGEFEESQAVLVSWPSYAFDKDTNIVEPFLPGKGLIFDDKGGFKVVDIIGYIIDLFEDSPFPPIWAQLIDAIQKECTVWIRVADLADTVALKEYLASKNVPLTNYEFLSDPDRENAFWCRDFGPYGAYFGDNDSLFFIDAEYYPWRPIDNDFPELLASMKGIPFYNTSLETEGGNIITDGNGTAYFGNVIYWNNADSVGKALTKKSPWSLERTRQEMTKAFNLKNRYILNSLNCDGGTGHLDLYLKMLDDETFIISRYPTEFNNPNFSDFSLIAANRNTINQHKSVHNTNFRILEIPLPTDDDGTQKRTNCTAFNQDARNFINGLIVNKSFIFPVYSDDESGNLEQTREVVELLQSYLPGYRIVPIDSRALSPLGGAIHCITMQIPADNPVRIIHKPIRGKVNDLGTKEINAIIQNKSGIKRAELFWKYEKDTEWKKVHLTGLDSLYIGFINSEDSDNVVNYYIEAETNNGKIAHRPMSAPDGYYSYYKTEPTSVIEPQISGVKLTPNPASDYIEISGDINNNSTGQIKIEIFNTMGINLTPNGIDIQNGKIDISSMPAGAYFIKINGKIEKFIKL